MRIKTTVNNVPDATLQLQIAFSAPPGDSRRGFFFLLLFVEGPLWRFDPGVAGVMCLNIETIARTHCERTPSVKNVSYLKWQLSLNKKSRIGEFSVACE